MDNPALYGHPDHYSTRYQGPQDAGGIHRNCSISNQVYYLAIEGGTNRTSRLSVQGVGGGNRDQIEKVMYRAFTLMMPSDAASRPRAWSRSSPRATSTAPAARRSAR